MPNAGFGFSPTSLSDSDLQGYIDYYNTLTTRGLASAGNTGTSGVNASFQNTLTQLKNEQAKRQASTNQQTQQQTLSGLLAPVSAPQNAFDQNAYMQNLQNSAQGQRQAIGNVYQNQQALGLQGLNDQYNQLNKQAIENAAALGNLRSPAFQGSTLANLQAQRLKDTTNLLGQLGVGQGQALTGVEQGLGQQLAQGQQFGAGLQSQNQNYYSGLNAQRQGQLAGLLQGNNQFNQGFGLQNQIFNSQQGQQGLENSLNIEGLANATRLGQAQANAQRPTGIQQFGQVASGLGGLLGGIGSLAGGLKGLSALGSAGQAFGGASSLMGGGNSLRQNSGFTPRNYGGY